MARKTLDSHFRRRVRSGNRTRFGCLNSEPFAKQCQLANVRTRPEIPKGSLATGSEATRSGPATAVDLSTDRCNGGGSTGPPMGCSWQCSGVPYELLRGCFRTLLLRAHVDINTLDLPVQGRQRNARRFRRLGLVEVVLLEVVHGDATLEPLQYLCGTGIRSPADRL